MNVSASLFATGFAALLLGGCACPTVVGLSSKGKVVDQTYTACDLPKGQGRIAVVYRDAHEPHPHTEWALVGTYGEEDWCKVTRAATSPLQRDADTYGLKFRTCPGVDGAPPISAAPDPLMVTLVEEQLLTVFVSYAESGKCGPIARRRWR